jgi:hypothetical protein
VGVIGMLTGLGPSERTHLFVLAPRPHLSKLPVLITTIAKRNLALNMRFRMHIELEGQSVKF